MNITVVKRDGTRENYDANKINLAIEDAAEGFPDMCALDFIEMFERTHRGSHGFLYVTRIEFSYVER